MNKIALSYTVTDLGILSGFESSRATSVNDREQVIGHLSGDSMDVAFHGFLWTEGQMRDLGKVLLKSINNKGQIVGAKHPEMLRFSATIYGASRFKYLLKNTSAMSVAECINDCGQVVGHMQSTNWKTPAEIKRDCFVWEDGKRRYLDVPDGFKAGDAVAINQQGMIAGWVWREHPNDEHAIVWKPESTELVDEPAGFRNSKAFAINTHGHILIRAVDSNWHELLTEAAQGIETSWQDDREVIHKGLNDWFDRLSAIPDDAWQFRQQSFLWKDGQMQMIAGLATALNDQDQVVGWTGCTLSPEDLAKGKKSPYAFLWQNDDLIDLNDLLPPESGWHLTRANGINNQGQIVGDGNVGNKTRAFLLTPITK